MNIELKQIAESKVRQLGGDVCGVLVRKGDKLAAVDEHGRVTWLQESQHNAGQSYINWLVATDGLPDDKVPYTPPGRAQCGQGAEPSGVWQFYQDGEWHVGMNRHNHRENTEAAGLPTRDLYTHPQPVHQGSVPDYVNEALQRLIENGGNLGPASREDALVVARYRRELLATLQPEGDGWVKCSERLPTEEDQYVWLYFRDHGVSEELWRWDDDIGVHGETHWKPTGLKRPQPPEEGKGDE